MRLVPLLKGGGCLSALCGFLLTLHLLVPAQASGQSDGVVIPDTISIGTVRVETCDSVTFPIFNNGSEALRIDDIILNSAGQRFTLSSLTATQVSRIDSGSSHFVTLLFCPDGVGCVADSLIVRGGPVGGGKTWDYRIGIGGCGGIPQGSLSGDSLAFPPTEVNDCSSLQLSVVNTGSFPLNILELRFAEGRVFSSSDLSSLPFSLLPGEERKLDIDFCPTEGGKVEDVIRVIDDGDIPTDPVILRGQGLKYRFGMPDIIDFGDVPLGGAKDTFLIVQNRDVTASLNILRSALTGGDGGFAIEEIIPPDARQVLPGDTVRLNISFRPTGQGSAVGGVLLEDDQSLFGETSLVGKGVIPSIRLDTAIGTAGELIRLTLSVDRTGDLLPEIGEYRFLLTLPPHALFPRELSDNLATMEYQPDGRLLIQGNHGGSVPAGGKLLSITFRGLSTGDSANYVRIEEGELTGITPLSIAGEGLVLLSGCDIGRSQGVVRKPVSLTVAPNPVTDNLVISCRVPPESHPVLTLYTMLAERVEEYQLPDVRGDDPLHIRLVDVQPGLYLLVLEAGEDRDVEVVLIQ